MRHQNGGPPAGAPLLRLVEVLEDGQWHRLEDVITEVGKAIPPGRAVRRNELARRSAGGPAERKRPTSHERVIAAGKRAIVNDTINSAQAFFERTPATRPRDPERMIRMVKMPPRVARDRAFAAQGTPMQADELVEKVLTADSPRIVVQDLTRSMVDRLAVRLVERLKDEIRGDLRDVASTASEEAAGAVP